MINILKALADENRMRILNLLMTAELCVCEIETILQLTQSNASRHLNKLKTSDLIVSSKDGQWVHYHVSETFKNNCPGLIKDIQTYFHNTDIFKDDLQRYEKYHLNNLSCSDIKSNIEHVLTVIEGE